MFKFTPQQEIINNVTFDEINNTVRLSSKNRYNKTEFTISSDDFIEFSNNFWQLFLEITRVRSEIEKSKNLSPKSVEKVVNND